MNSKGLPCPLNMAALPGGKPGNGSFTISQFDFEIPVAIQNYQSAANTQKDTRSEENGQNGIYGRGAVSEEHQDNIPGIADGIRQVHQEPDIGLFFRNSDQPFEQGGMDRYIRNINAKAHEHHKREFAQPGL